MSFEPNPLQERLAETCRDHFGGGVMAQHFAAAEALLPVFAAYLRKEETGDLMAEAMEKHHLVHGQPDAMGNTPCVCGTWWDSADMEGWDQHLANVGLRALADSISPEATPNG